MRSGLLVGLVGAVAVMAGCSAGERSAADGEAQASAATRPADPAQIAGATFVRTGAVTGARSVIIPACPTCEGGSLGTLVDLELQANGCLDALGEVATRATPRADGSVDLAVAAIDLLDRRSLVAFCSGDSMTRRTSVMIPGAFEADAIHLELLAGDDAAARVRDPEARIGGGSLVRTGRVASAREVVLAACPACLGGPPGTRIELELAAGGCFDALGPIAQRAVPQGDGTLDLEVAAINLADRRSLAAFCDQTGVARRATITVPGSYAPEQIRLHLLAAPRDAR